MAEILNKADIEHFISNGYIKIENAFPRQLAEEAVDILWKDIPFEKTIRDSWPEPVIRLGMYTQKPIVDAVNTPVLQAAFNQLVGADRWIPCRSVGTFPVRFPAEKAPNDVGFHVDVSFPGDDPVNYFTWRANIKSKGRGLLMLVLYSDVSGNDAPTIIRKKSHQDVARLLYPEGEKGLSFMEIAEKLQDFPPREEALATGKAGTVYLCHPFLVHSAQAHHGTAPKFMAQPPLLLRGELTIADSEVGYAPVEEAIRLAVK